LINNQLKKLNTATLRVWFPFKIIVLRCITLTDHFLCEVLTPSINKNDKSDREQNREYLANESSDFNRTKKFGISAKNYTRKEPKINDLDQGWDTGIRQEIRQPKKIESATKKRTKPTILGNSTQKYKGKLNSK
jgi:hypothetical protein